MGSFQTSVLRVLHLLLNSKVVTLSQIETPHNRFSCMQRHKHYTPEVVNGQLT